MVLTTIDIFPPAAVYLNLGLDMFLLHWVKGGSTNRKQQFDVKVYAVASI